MSGRFNQIDIAIGTRLRDRRTLSGLSREQLAERLRIDPNDLELHESGAMRVSADRLFRIAKTLGVRPAYFFGRSDNGQRSADELDRRSHEKSGAHLAPPDQGLRLHHAFLSLKDSARREALVALVVEMAKSENTIGADPNHAISNPAAFGRGADVAREAWNRVA